MDRSLRAYLNDLEAGERLAPELTTELFRARRSAAPEKAPAIEDRLFRGNLWRVVSLTRRWHKMRDVPTLDLIQEGNLGLRRAIQTYDCERGVYFGEYSRIWIWRSVNYALKLELSPVSGLNPQRHQIDEFKTRSFDPEAEIAGVLDDRDLETEYDETVALQRVSRYLNKLTPRMRVVLEARVLKDPEEAYTQREIAHHLGLHKARVQQLERRARELMGQLLKDPARAETRPDRSNVAAVVRFHAEPRTALRRQRRARDMHLISFGDPPRLVRRLIYRPVLCAA